MCTWQQVVGWLPAGLWDPHAVCSGGGLPCLPSRPQPPSAPGPVGPPPSLRPRSLPALPCAPPPCRATGATPWAATTGRAPAATSWARASTPLWAASGEDVTRLCKGCWAMPSDAVWQPMRLRGCSGEVQRPRGRAGAATGPLKWRPLLLTSTSPSSQGGDPGGGGSAKGGRLNTAP